MRLERYIKEDINEGVGGLSKARLKTLIYKSTKKCTYNQLYKDSYWNGPQCIWNAFDKLDLNWHIDSADYKRYNKEVKMPDTKEWTFTITWHDNKGKEKTQKGIVTAAGAGTMDDPLSAYDLNLVLF